MKRIAVVLAAVVALLAGALSRSPEPTAASVSGAVTVTATVTRESREDGRLETVKQIRDRRGRVIGWGNTICWSLENGSAQCVGTVVLPRGKISIAGTRHNQSYFVLSVVGGTGLYVGAGGTLIGRTVRLSPRRELLVFFLS